MDLGASLGVHHLEAVANPGQSLAVLLGELNIRPLALDAGPAVVTLGRGLNTEVIWNMLRLLMARDLMGSATLACL